MQFFGSRFRFETLLEVSSLASAVFLVSCSPQRSNVTQLSKNPISAPKAIILREAFKTCPGENSFFGVKLECANFRVPLDWKSQALPSNRPINYFVRRVSNVKTSSPDTQMWLLQGGPGSPGDGLIGMAVGIANVLPNVEVFVPDHRGIGGSTRLGCSAEGVNTPGRLAVTPGEQNDCVQDVVRTWGQGLASFNVTNMAYDVTESIRALGGGPGGKQRAFVYGVSFGSYLTQRILAVEPEFLTGAVLDGICAADECYVKNQPEWIDEGAKSVLAACRLDSVCSAKMGPDPYATFVKGFQRLKSRACVPNPAAQAADWDNLAEALMKNPAGWNAAAFMSYRSLRCNDKDKVFLSKLREALGGPLVSQNKALDESKPTPIDPASVPPLAHSSILQDVIFKQELWSPKPWKRSTRNLVIGAVDDGSRERILNLYPEMNGDRFAHRYADTRTPLLMINGTHDVLTPLPLAQRVRSFFSKPYQTFVTMPYGPHGAINTTYSRDNPDLPCGYLILGQFLKNPQARLDISCTAHINPTDYSGNDVALKGKLGFTENLWGE